MLTSFPFKIKDFHSDNGSEYINYSVAELLEKMRVKFAKSRPRWSNDNGLVESKMAQLFKNYTATVIFHRGMPTVLVSSIANHFIAILTSTGLVISRR